MSGKGRLTIGRTDAIQNLYRRAIRDNVDDGKAISRCTWAILHHYSSTYDEPKHDGCPVGETSWCSFQCDKDTGQSLHKPVKYLFTPAIIKAVKPVFTRLANVNFLESVKHCSTQNPCEALNHVIWSLAPKEQHVSPMQTSLAVNIGVCIFNSGTEYTLKQLFNRSNLD